METAFPLLAFFLQTSQVFANLWCTSFCNIPTWSHEARGWKNVCLMAPVGEARRVS